MDQINLNPQALSEEEYEYDIPKKFNTRFEFFPGIGFIEVIIIAIGLLIATLLLFITNIVLNMFKDFVNNHGTMALLLKIGWFLPGFLIPFALVYQEPRNGMSLRKVLKDVKKFKSKQKRYIYVHGKGR